MRAAVLSILLAGSVLVSKNSCAADLPRPLKPAAQHVAPLSPEAQRKELFEEYLRFLRKSVY